VIPQNQHHISIETTHCVAKTILQKKIWDMEKLNVVQIFPAISA
jgi:hypothetical protein